MSSILNISLILFIITVPHLQAAETKPNRPNVVMIISDDQHYADFGFMGNPDVFTPHLDQLAAQSARYINGYVPSSVCRPSLVTLLTGLYPHQHGVHFNHPPPGFSKLTKSPEINKTRYDQLRNEATRLIKAAPSLPRLLATRGYRSLQTGKFWEGHWRNAGFTTGMTIAEPSGSKYGDKQLANGDVVAHGNGDHGLAIGRESMQPIYDFIDSCRNDPFFVWYAPFLPHLPHDSPQKYQDLYKDRQDIPPHRIPYYASIAQFDDTVGQLLNYLDQHNLTENTIILFVVDNGWEPDPKRLLKNRTEWEHTKRSKRAPFDAGLRTPILIRWPYQIKPATHPELVSSIDLVPTILAATGTEFERTTFPGTNLLPSARGIKPLPKDRAVFGAIYPGDATSLGHPERDVAYRWVRQDQLKLIVPVGKHPWKNYLKEPALYNVVNDPGETRNLINKPEFSAQVTTLNRSLNEWWDISKTVRQ